MTFPIKSGTTCALTSDPCAFCDLRKERRQEVHNLKSLIAQERNDREAESRSLREELIALTSKMDSFLHSDRNIPQKLYPPYTNISSGVPVSGWNGVAQEFSNHLPNGIQNTNSYNNNDAIYNIQRPRFPRPYLAPLPLVPSLPLASRFLPVPQLPLAPRHASSGPWSDPRAEPYQGPMRSIPMIVVQKDSIGYSNSIHKNREKHGCEADAENEESIYELPPLPPTPRGEESSSSEEDYVNIADAKNDEKEEDIYDDSTDDPYITVCNKTRQKKKSQRHNKHENTSLLSVDEIIEMMKNKCYFIDDFHGNINGILPERGYFMIRIASHRSPLAPLTLCFQGDGKICKVQVGQRSRNVFALGKDALSEEKEFTCVDELIEHYKVHPIYTYEGTTFHLQTPVNFFMINKKNRSGKKQKNKTHRGY